MVNHNLKLLATKLFLNILGKLGTMMVKKIDKQNPQINLDHITCNDCEEKVWYVGNSEFYTQTKLKEEEEAFIKMKQVKYGTRPSDVGG